MLCHPRTSLTADALKKIAIGVVLEQHKPLGCEPWLAFDRNLLASIRAIRHFRHMVEGHTFTLYTDHDSLILSLRKRSEPLTARQTYQLSCIAEYLLSRGKG